MEITVRNTVEIGAEVAIAKVLVVQFKKPTFDSPEEEWLNIRCHLLDKSC